MKRMEEWRERSERKDRWKKEKKVLKKIEGCDRKFKRRIEDVEEDGREFLKVDKGEIKGDSIRVEG